MKRTRTNKFSILLGLMAIVALEACGSKSLRPTFKSEPSTGDAEKTSSPSPTAEASFDGDNQTPPQEYFDALFAERLARLDQSGSDGLALVGGKATQILFIDFDGAQIQRGYKRGQTFMLCKANLTVAQSSFSPAAQQDIGELVQEYFDDAGTAVQVVLTQPMSGDYTTIIVANKYAELGCGADQNILGIAPLDMGNSNPNDIGFAFVSSISDQKVASKTIAHEAGHTFGLDHTTNKQDLMYASESPNQEGFAVGRLAGSTSKGKIQDGPAVLQKNLGLKEGTLPTTVSSAQPQPVIVPSTVPSVQPAAPAIPGSGQIATIGNLIPQLGAGNVVDLSSILATIVQLIPGPASQNLSGLDKIFTILGMAQGAVAHQAATSTGSTPTTGIGGVVGKASAALSGLLGSGLVTSVGSLASLFGHPEITIAVSAAQALIGLVSGDGSGNENPSTNTGAPLTLASLPNIAEAFQVDQVADFAELLRLLESQRQLIQQNFSGDTQCALMSALKVAYSQAYAAKFKVQ